MRNDFFVCWFLIAISISQKCATQRHSFWLLVEATNVRESLDQRTLANVENIGKYFTTSDQQWENAEIIFSRFERNTHSVLMWFDLRFIEKYFQQHSEETLNIINVSNSSNFYFIPKSLEMLFSFYFPLEQWKSEENFSPRPNSAS